MPSLWEAQCTLTDSTRRHSVSRKCVLVIKETQATPQILRVCTGEANYLPIPYQHFTCYIKFGPRSGVVNFPSQVTCYQMSGLWHRTWVSTKHWACPALTHTHPCMILISSTQWPVPLQKTERRWPVDNKGRSSFHSREMSTFKTHVTFGS